MTHLLKTVPIQRLNHNTINFWDRGVTILTGTTGAIVKLDYRYHYAYFHIAEVAQAGIVTTRDRNGNRINVFRPNASTTRAEGIMMLNRLRRYIERMLRG